MPSKCLFLFKFHLLSSCKANSLHLTPMPKWPWCAIHARFPLDSMHICYLRNFISSFFCLLSGLRDWVSFASLLTHVLFFLKKKRHDRRRSWETCMAHDAWLGPAYSPYNQGISGALRSSCFSVAFCLLVRCLWFLHLLFTNLCCLGNSRLLCCYSSVFASLWWFQL